MHVADQYGQAPPPDHARVPCRRVSSRGQEAVHLQLRQNDVLRGLVGLRHIGHAGAPVYAHMCMLSMPMIAVGIMRLSLGRL